MKITSEILQAFSEVSRDPNRIHLDESVARQMGLPGVIAHGMLIAAHLEGRLRAEAGPAREIRKLQFRFRAMTLLGDTLEVAPKPHSEVEEKVEAVASGSNGEVKAVALGFLDRARP